MSFAEPRNATCSRVALTFYVVHVLGSRSGLDAFDRRTEKVSERIRLSVPEAREINALEDHSGVLWITYTSGNGLASWNRHTRQLTLYSFKDREPPASELSGVAGIHEDADGNLWLATHGSGLVRIDPSRRTAVRYRHSPLDLDLEKSTSSARSPGRFKTDSRSDSHNEPGERNVGRPRIHGELLKLGIDIGETSVSKYMIRGRRPPSQTWRTFLHNHFHSLVSVDFFTVPTIRFQILYVFSVLAHERRRTALWRHGSSDLRMDGSTTPGSFSLGHCSTISVT